MNYKVAAKFNEVLKIKEDYSIVFNGVELDDPMCKGYVYASLYFYDEVQKEVEKLKLMVQKLYDEVSTDLAITDPAKLLMEMSTRANRAIGDDGLDAIIKEFLGEKTRHVALVVDEREKAKYIQICEAILIELVTAFHAATFHAAMDLEGGVKKFKLTNEYIAAMTPRQKVFISPAIRIVALENQMKINRLEVSKDFTVKYVPISTGEHFKKQEDTIKDQIKEFMKKAVGEE
ncbi:MAG: hypothetical protein FWC00_04910 [Firmicutes bacterium]|nr:hypothetical protein [Bacillota bacterium]